MKEVLSLLLLTLLITSAWVMIGCYTPGIVGISLIALAFTQLGVAVYYCWPR